MDLKLPEGTWVVVCDGRKSIVLENIGDKDYPTSAPGAPSIGGRRRPARWAPIVPAAYTRASAPRGVRWSRPTGTTATRKNSCIALAARLDKAVQAKEVHASRHRRPAAGAGNDPESL